MQITLSYHWSFYGGQGSSTEVPGKFPVAINGRPYMVVENSNELYREHFHAQSLDIIRQQADSSGQPGEATITPEGLWRRNQDDWTHGAGQTHRDHPTSDFQRYRSSKGIDVWTRFKASLLGDTKRVLTSANTNLRLMPAGTRLYLTDGNALKYTSDVTVASPTWTTVTGTSATAQGYLASDGTNVWVTATGANGIYATTASTGAASAYVTSAVAGPIAYVKGRLMAASGPAIYNILTTGALPVALFTQGNSAFVWVGFAEGAGQIYAAGYAGDKSLIYRTAVKTDATGLDAPVVAGELPTGEVVRSIQGYLGYVVLGSDKGVRFAQPNANGDLVIGSLIPTGASVYCMTGSDRFVWFGWTNYDGTSTGLGRLDLSIFTSPLTPAFASDLMATTQGTVLSVATMQGIRVYTVAESGVWAEQVVKVPSGSIDSGQITYGIPDAKVAMFVDLTTSPLVGSITAELATDNSTFGTIGILNDAGAVETSLQCNQQRARTFETRVVLTRANASDTAGPEIDRWTLRSYPAPTKSMVYTVPLMMHSEVQIDGTPYHYDVPEERARFADLLNRRALVTYQEGATSHTVFVDALNFLNHHRTLDHDDWEGTLVVTMKEFVS